MDVHKMCGSVHFVNALYAICRRHSRRDNNFPIKSSCNQQVFFMFLWINLVKMAE